MTKDDLHEREPHNIMQRYKAERTTLADAIREIRRYGEECVRRAGAESPLADLLCDLATAMDNGTYVWKATDAADLRQAAALIRGRATEPSVAPDPIARLIDKVDDVMREAGFTPMGSEPSAELAGFTVSRSEAEPRVLKRTEPTCSDCMGKPGPDGKIVHKPGCSVEWVTQERQAEPVAPHEHRWVLPSPPMNATATNYFCGDCGYFPGPPVKDDAPIRRTVVDCPDMKDTCRRNCTTECLRLSENRGGSRDG